MRTEHPRDFSCQPERRPPSAGEAIHRNAGHCMLREGHKHRFPLSPQQLLFHRGCKSSTSNSVLIIALLLTHRHSKSTCAHSVTSCQAMFLLQRCKHLPEERQSSFTVTAIPHAELGLVFSKKSTFLANFMA